jgi:RimJ/RimL family protein N-acetyltransferase
MRNVSYRHPLAASMNPRSKLKLKMKESDKNVKIRQFISNDISKLAELCNNKNIWDNLRDFIPFPYTEKDAQGFIDFCSKENPVVTFAIDLNENLVGCIGLVPQNDIYRLSAEIGYWIGEPYWGFGIATQAVRLIVDYGFKKLNLIRIFTGVFDYNVPSQRVLEKAGFKKEGVFEKSIIKNGQIHDEYRYSIINNNKK